MSESSRTSGKQVRYGDWSDGAFETQDGCYFLARGINQPFRGLRKNADRLDYVVVDDIEDRRVANNARLVHERTERILGDIGGAFSKDRQRMVVCNNYITKRGVIAHLLSAFESKPHVDVSRVNLTRDGWVPTWPEYYTTTEIKRIVGCFDENTLQREYYNQPIEVGRIFKHEWIVFEKNRGISHTRIFGRLLGSELQKRRRLQSFCSGGRMRVAVRGPGPLLPKM